MIRHDGKPDRERGDVPAEVQDRVAAEAARILGSPYVKMVEQIRPLVAGKAIVATKAGRSGFMLRLDDGSWVLCYLSHDRLEWKAGRRGPWWWQRALMNSRRYGDGSAPLSYDTPYAWERCDVAEAVAKSCGSTIETLAIGSDTFNFTFPDGHELDTSIVKAADGKLALRVFWEQW